MRLIGRPRERPTPESQRRIALRSGVRQSVRFFTFLARKSSRDGILLYAAALAFTTLLSLVPLLAAFSFIGTRVFANYQERIIDALVHVLPYSELTIRARLAEFLSQADTLPQFGLIGFMVVTLLAFATVEEVLNRIWGVTSQRPFRIRLLSFTLLVFWGPLLIGAAFSALLVLGQRPDLKVLLAEAWVLQLVPFLAVLVGLTMLYWMVPYTDVRFSAAFAGGLSAASLFELLRWGFRLYLQAFGGTADIIYGGFALALFFMISIEAAWTIALLGSEVAYLVQHFRRFDDPSALHLPPRETWIGVVALAAIGERFLRGEPITSLPALASQLVLPPEALRRALEPLIQGRVLAHPDATSDRFVLAADPHRLPMAGVFALYDDERGELLQPLGASLSSSLHALRDRLLDARRRGLRELTLAELLESPPPAIRGRPADGAPGTGPVPNAGPWRDGR